MAECKVIVIETFDLDRQPGSILKDCDGNEHVLADKMPVIGLDFNEITKLPLEKWIGVEIVNDHGNKVEITTEKPYGIKTQDGETHFVVFRENIKED